MKKTLSDALPLGFVIATIYFVYQLYHNINHIEEYVGWKAWANGIATVLHLLIVGGILYYLFKLIKEDILQTKQEESPNP